MERQWACSIQLMRHAPPSVSSLLGSNTWCSHLSVTSQYCILKARAWQQLFIRSRKTGKPHNLAERQHIMDPFHANHLLCNIASTCTVHHKCLLSEGVGVCSERERCRIRSNMNCKHGENNNSVNLWCATSTFVIICRRHKQQSSQNMGHFDSQTCWISIHWWDVSFQLSLFYSKGKLHKLKTNSPFSFVSNSQLQHMKLNTNTTTAHLVSLTVGKSGSIWAPWSVMSIFSSPWLHNRQVVMRCCASVKRWLRTRLAFVISFSPFFSFPFLPVSHSPAGFSQMEVAQHSRPALHNLRMKEGVLPITRVSTLDALMMRRTSETRCAHIFILKIIGED